MKPIIKVENLSKQYRLGVIGTGTLSNDLKRWWYKVRGKEDPFLKVGEVNDRAHKGFSEYVWALKDINMEIMPGEVVGIIGKNGAGKSTLLKILSKVTGPTTGSIKFDGRIGSLLEVGTGFHPELTGRENIFLNGAILGMTKQEIRSKLDEIVDFSGVERYIDTPVKRYSSGMKVRLGFAVAAHLEPEILVVDEVLAVGDAEFQKKAIGKMQDVSKNDGRTVLFVSHNMQAVSSLTQKSVLLIDGTVNMIDKTDVVIDKYVSSTEKIIKYVDNKSDNGSLPLIVKLIELDTTYKNNVVEHGDSMTINIEIDVKKKLDEGAMAVYIYNMRNQRILHFLNSNSEIPFLNEKGKWGVKLNIPKCRLYPDSYYLEVIISNRRVNSKLVHLKEICHFEVVVRDKLRYNYWKPRNAIYVEDSKWNISMLK